MAIGNVYTGQKYGVKTDDDYRRRAEAARAALEAQNAARGAAAAPTQGAIGDSSVAPNTGYRAGNTKGATQGAASSLNGRPNAVFHGEYEPTSNAPAAGANPYQAALRDYDVSGSMTQDMDYGSKEDWDQHDWSQYATAAERDEAAAAMGMSAKERLQRFGWTNQDGTMFAGANNMGLGKDALSLFSGNFKGADGNIYNYDTAPDEVLESMGLARMYGTDSQGNTLTWIGKFDDAYALARKAQEVLEKYGEEAAAKFWEMVPGARALDLYIQKDVNGNPLYTGESYGVSESGETHYDPETEYSDANGNTYPDGYIDTDFYHTLQELGEQFGVGQNTTEPGTGTPGGNGGNGGTGGTGGTGTTPTGTTTEPTGTTPTGTTPAGTTEPTGTTVLPTPSGASAETPQDTYDPAPEYGGNPYQEIIEQLIAQLGQQYQGSPYQAAIEELLEKMGEEWQGSPYQEERDAALRRAQEMQWDYDPSTDPVWQAYQKQYRREGQRATEDTLGRIAGMTGGMPSSYAATAATQAGDYYASQLSDKLPELYQDAYQRYLQDYMKEMNISDQYAGFDDREYSRWRDQQGQDLNRLNQYAQMSDEDYSKWYDQMKLTLEQLNQYGILGQDDYNKYLTALDQYNKDRAFQHTLNREAKEDAWYEDERDYERNKYIEERDYERAWQEDQRMYERWMDRVNLEFREREWAQKMLEYADSQKWKAAEWEQYLREYEDQMTEKEKEWAYRVWQDQVAEEHYKEQMAYQYEQDERDNQYRDDVYEQSLREYDDEQYDNALKLWYSTGVVPDGYAEILGYPAGTKWDDVYGDQEPEEVSESGVAPDTGYSGGGSSGGSGGKGGIDLSDEDAMAAALGEKTGNAQTFVLGVKHEDGSPMSTGWQDWWPEIRDAFDQGASTAELKQTILWLATNGIITSAEATLMGKKLGIYKSGNSGGGAGR